MNFAKDTARRTKYSHTEVSWSQGWTWIASLFDDFNVSNFSGSQGIVIGCIAYTVLCIARGSISTW